MVTSDPSTRPSPPPEAAGEEAAAAGAVPEQPQGELGVLHVAVRQQQEVPDAAGRGQQAEGPQGPPQLGAAPYRRGELRGVERTQAYSLFSAEYYSKALTGCVTTHLDHDLCVRASVTERPSRRESFRVVW